MKNAKSAAPEAKPILHGEHSRRDQYTAPELPAQDLAPKPARFKFPIAAGQKAPPLIKAWEHNASGDPQQLEKWENQFPGCNFGLACGPSDLTVIDIDPRHGGEESFQALQDDFDTYFPPTRTASTPSGGRHLYYAGRTPKSSSNKLGPGIDTRSTGGYVVLPGSRTDKGEYTWTDTRELAPVPFWVIEKLAASKTPVENRNTPACELDDPAAISRAVSFLLKEASIDATGYEVACQVRDLGISEDVCFDLMWEHYAGRCVDPWEPEILRQKVQNAYRYAQNQCGVLAPREIIGLLPCPDELGDFPASVISGLAGDFARLFAAYMEPPIQFFYFSFLTCLGSILADRITLDSQLRPSPRFYLLILGQSADDRKSTAIGQTVKFFRDALLMEPENSLAVCNGVGSAEGLQKRLMQNNKLLLVFDEFKQFVSKCRIEGAVLLPAVVTLFESNTYENYTKKSAILINDAHLSILGACTLDTFQAMWSSAFTDIGLNNRLFLVTGCGERRFSIPRVVPIEKVQQLALRLQAIINEIGSHKVYSVDSAALSMFDTWYLGLGKSIHAKRLDTMAMRLMVLLAANEKKKTVDVEITTKALRLVNWQLEVRERVDPIDADSAAAKIEEKIRRALRQKGPMRERELKQAVNANRSGLWLYEQSKKNLISAGEIFFHGRLKKFMLAEDEQRSQNGSQAKNGSKLAET